jgi:hypothetical protein
MQTERTSLKSILLVVALSLAILHPFAGNGQEEEAESKTFRPGEFSALFLEGSFGVQLIQGSAPSVEMRVTDPKAFEYLNITNKDGMLHLHVDRKPFDLTRITLYVTFEELKHLRIFGSIHMETRGYLEFDDLEMVLEGGAKVNMQLKARSVAIENIGGVLCEFRGVTKSLGMRLAGAGHIQAGELKSEDVRFTIEGVGTGVVYATKTLYAKISGAGKIKYFGNPRVTENIDGLGSVKQAK